MNRQRMLISLTLIALTVGLLVWNQTAEQPARYFRNEGRIFGTVYNIQYEAHKDLHDSILATLRQVDSTLSMFNSRSLIARINRGEDIATTADFEAVFQEAQRISALSDGAFDITVAPLVNAWGFGFQNKATITPQRIDSLRELVGYDKVSLVQHHIRKSDSRVQMDAGAIAKGFACDQVAKRLQQLGCQNLLVEIGGEIVAKGNNSQGQPWTIGISKPVDDPAGMQRQLQDKLTTTDLCMATSGNYRNFYYEGTERRSHTIDPRTGYPVQHSLLSASVTASSCMRADALATACMVMGEDDAIRLIDKVADAECYLIIAEQDSLRIRTSTHWLK